MRQHDRELCNRFDGGVHTGAIDPLAPRVFENPSVERLEALAVIEMAEMRELVAERVDQARVLERSTRRRVLQADADRPVPVADAQPALHLRALGLDRAVAESEDPRDARRIAFELLDQQHGVCIGAATKRSTRAVRGDDDIRSGTRNGARLGTCTARDSSNALRSRQAFRSSRYHRLVASEHRNEMIPLFPLSNVVLFPQLQCQLHIFEPRYRQMIGAALDGARRIGMATVRPEHRAAMGGDPPLFSIGCVGDVQQARQRDDGRYDIVLFGAQRFRIVEEIPRDSERLYRVARVELLDERFDAEREGIPLQGRRADAIELLTQVLRYVAPDSAHELDPRRFSGIDDTAFVSALCQLLDLPAAEKQGLLEAAGPTERCDRLIAILHFRLAELRGGMPGPPGSLH